MEKLIKKIRSLTMTLFILSLISLIWLVVDFFILKSFNTQYNYNFEDFNWIMFIASFIPIILTIIVIFFLSPFVWRLKSKYNSELKKMKSEQTKSAEKETQKLIEEKPE
jgi:uncharacterized membrane protein